MSVSSVSVFMSCDRCKAKKRADRVEQFGDDFFAKIDGVTNALDNVMARESAPSTSYPYIGNG